MTLLTALELAGNYPENILINSSKGVNDFYSAFCYMTRNGSIHKLMLSTNAVFETEEEATNYMREVAIDCKEKYNR